MAELEELQPFESELLWARYQWRQVVYQELAALEPGFPEKNNCPFTKIMSIYQQFKIIAEKVLSMVTH